MLKCSVGVDRDNCTLVPNILQFRSSPTWYRDLKQIKARTKSQCSRQCSQDHCCRQPQLIRTGRWHAPRCSWHPRDRRVPEHHSKAGGFLALKTMVRSPCSLSLCIDCASQHRLLACTQGFLQAEPQFIACVCVCAVLDELTVQLERLNNKCKRVQRQGASRTHSQHCGNYNRSEHIQALHARAKVYTNCHKL